MERVTAEITAGSLAGKAAFVAGGSSGINLGIAQRLAEEGAAVGIMSRNREKVDAAVRTITDAGGEASGYVADVRDYDAVEAALSEFAQRTSGIDIVVSGAAGNFVSPALGMSANGFKTIVDIDLIGTFNVFRACFAFLRRPGASLIAITAAQGQRPSPFQSHVCAAKAGVNLLTQCLAMEWGPEGVRVNAISPGPIAGTEGMARLTPTAEAEAQLKARLALRDYGTPRDIAELALFVSSDSARYMTGAILYCDGGSVLGDSSMIGHGRESPPVYAKV